MNCRFKFKRFPALCCALIMVCSMFLIPQSEVKATTASSGTAASESTESSEEKEVAVAWPKGPSISSPSACVIEVNTGTILYEKNDHQKLYPASITKILTTLLTLETCDLDEVLTFSKTAVYENEGDTSHIYRDVGEQMTVEQTLYAVMLASANECAYEAAEYSGTKMGGDVSTFIDAMNARAEELGCTDSHFNNPNGLPDTEHYTTAYDFALISCEAYKNEEFRKICGTKKYTIAPTNKHSEETYLSNHHKILHVYHDGNYVNPYCTGGKTGYTKAAKQTLVTYAEKDGITLCIVVMHANSPDQLNDTNTLINYCFNHYTKYNISESDTSLRTENEKDYGLLNENRGFVTLDTDSYVILPKGASFSDVQIEKTEENTDDALAVVNYTYDGREVGSAKIVVDEGAMAVTSVFNGETAVSSKTDSKSDTDSGKSGESDATAGSENASESESESKTGADTATEPDTATDSENDFALETESETNVQETAENPNADNGSEQKSKVFISPIGIAAIVTALLLIILVVFLLTHFGLTIRQALRERTSKKPKKDWRTDKKRQERLRRVRRQREQQRLREERRTKETAERKQRRTDTTNTWNPNDEDEFPDVEDEYLDGEDGFLDDPNDPDPFADLSDWGDRK